MEQEKWKELYKEFETRFGEGDAPKAFFAPGRVNLIGEHTDYNGGHVFPCALTLGIWALARKRQDRRLRFFSKNVERIGVVECSLDKLAYRAEDGWSNYPKGVIWALAEKGHPLPSGMDFMIWGDIPNGAGLSSSAALEVLTGLTARDLFGLEGLDMVQLALIGQKAENEFCGMNCGIMDQFASAMGKAGCAIFLDTNTLRYEYAPVQLPEARLVITNSKVKHSLVSSAYNERRRQCEEALRDLQRNHPETKTLGDLSAEEFEAWKDEIRDETCRRRAKHAVYENLRTVRAVEALKKDDIETFGRLMNESHVSLRDDYETSCPECDLLAELAWQQPGVLGSRITGGGFGGCTVSIVRNEAIETFLEEAGKTYLEKTGHAAEFYVVELGEGAHAL